MRTKHTSLNLFVFALLLAGLALAVVRDARAQVLHTDQQPSLTVRMGWHKSDVLFRQPGSITEPGRQQAAVPLGWDSQFGLPGYPGKPVGSLPDNRLVTLYLTRSYWQASIYAPSPPNYSTPVYGTMPMPGLVYAWNGGEPEELLRDVLWKKGVLTYSPITDAVVDREGRIYITGPFDTLVLPDGSKITARGLARWDNGTWQEFLPPGQDFSGAFAFGCTSPSCQMDTNYSYQLALDSLDRLYFFGASRVNQVTETAWVWDGSWADITPTSFHIPAVITGSGGNSGFREVLVDSDDRIYLLGLFDSPSGNYRIVRWDGVDWSLVGDATGNWSMGGNVMAGSFAPNGDLYVTGLKQYFIDGLWRQRTQVFIWDGVSWGELDSSDAGFPALAGTPYSLHFAEGGTLYLAGGVFAPSDANLHSLVRWNGAGWNTVGTANNFVCNSATGLGGGTLYEFSSLFEANGLLYANANCGTAYGIGHNRLLVWDGTAWDFFGEPAGINGIDWGNTHWDIHNPIPYFEIEEGADGWLYIAGPVNQAGPYQATGIARFNPYSYTWDTMGMPFRDVPFGSNIHGTPSRAGQVLGMAMDAENLFVYGNFTEIGGVSFPLWELPIAHYDLTGARSTWSHISIDFSEFDDYDFTFNGLMGMWDGKLYLAGRWRYYDNGIGDYITHLGIIYDPASEQFAPLGEPVLTESAAVEDMFIDPTTGHVYLGGTFGQGGGYSPAAIWDGADWSYLPAIDSLYSENIKVGITHLDGNIYLAWDNLLYKWDGLDYHDLSGVFVHHLTAPGSQMLVTALEPDPISGSLLIGGSFQGVETALREAITSHNIIHYDPASDTWTGLGGVTGKPPGYQCWLMGADVCLPYVSGIAQTANGLYIVGAFSQTADGTVSHQIARLYEQETGLLVTAETSSPMYLAQPVTLTIEILNRGPEDGTNLELLVELPLFATGYTFASGSGQCEFYGYLAVCALGELMIGESWVGEVSFVPLAAGRLSIVAEAFADQAQLFEGDEIAELEINVLAASDLEVSRSAAPVFPMPLNSAVTYVYTITNHGPSIAPQAFMVENWPPGAILSGYITSTAQTMCDVLDGIFGCFLGVLNPGQTITITAQLTQTEVVAFSHVLQVSSVAADPDASNNTVVTDIIVALPGVDLDVSLSVNPPEISTGELITLTAGVLNQGAFPASGVLLTMTLPISSSLGLGTDPACSLNSAGITLLCQVGDLLPGEGEVYTLPVHILAAGTITIPAAAHALEPDLNPDNQIAVGSVHIRGQADLAVRLAASLPELSHGAYWSTRILVENRGPHLAESVVLTTTVYASVISGVVPSDLCQVQGVEIICTWGEISPNSSQVITVSGQVVHTGLAGYTSWVASEMTMDPDPGNNHTEDLHTVTLANLNIQQSIDKVYLGLPFQTIITVTNDGPDTAEAVFMTYTMPVTASYLGSSRGGNQAATSCALDGAVVVCSLGDLPAGVHETITLTWKTEQVDTLFGFVELVTTTPLENPGNAIFVQGFGVREWHDLTLTITGTENVPANQAAQLIFNVHNNSIQAASGITLTYVMPAGFSLPVLPAECAQSLDLVTCALPDISPATTLPYALTVMSGAPEVTFHTGFLFGSHEELDFEDNASFFIQGVAAPDLAITLVPNPAPLVVDETITYTLNVSNIGIFGAEAITITISMTGTWEASAVHLAGGLCAIDDQGVEQEIICTLGGLTPGQSLPLLLQIEPTTPGEGGMLAMVNSASAELEYTNNVLVHTANVAGAGYILYLPLIFR